MASYDHTQTLMMKRPLAVISTISLAGCTHAPGPRNKRAGPPRDTTALVIVDRPTAIGFFPPARDSAEASEDGYSEGIAHIRFALDDARGCLGHDSRQTILVVDTAVRIRQRGRTHTLRFSRVDSLPPAVPWGLTPTARPRDER